MNKTMLWVFLAISAVLFLYPSITTLLDILDAIGNAAVVPTAAIETRDRAIIQVLGFASLYVFLGALLYHYNLQPNQQRKYVQDSPPSTNTNHVSKKIDAAWSFPVSILISLVAIGLQGRWGAFDASDLLLGLALPLLYAIAAGAVAGLVTYLIIINID